MSGVNAGASAPSPVTRLAAANRAPTSPRLRLRTKSASAGEVESRLFRNSIAGRWFLKQIDDSLRRHQFDEYSQPRTLFLAEQDLVQQGKDFARLVVMPPADLVDFLFDFLRRSVGMMRQEMNDFLNLGAPGGVGH